ncbi:TRAP transporter small permease [Nitrincola iocasae]|uniref:TRAP transporter small permease protein n=1 Tax=Nitrincola iocasae TaxID=2614693 RepID=A0A5J6LGY0_9GAMM|nr:TRAP transporter small permease [Nitrincola iocasae]QEW07920.1 TRAP transporter small permease [Nitrincola iocasae]
MNTFRLNTLSFVKTTTLMLASALLLTNILVILYAVMLRYLVGGAPIWTDEAARFLVIGCTFLAAGAVWVEGGHMRIALLETSLPTRLSQALVLYQWLLTLTLAVVAAVFSYRYAQSVGMFQTPGLGISRTWPLLSMPIGFGLLALQVLLHGPKRLPVMSENPE